MALTMQNSTNAMIRKLMTAVMNAPYLKTSLPSPKTSHIMASKLTLPRIPKIGLMRLSVREVTSVENAPPMITPMAMSIMLPFRAKALNSSKNFFISNLLKIQNVDAAFYFFSSFATVWAALSR